MGEPNKEQQQTLSTYLSNELTLHELALPGDLNRERFIQNAVYVLNNNTMLQKCSKASLAKGILRGAYLGLDFANNEAYLIPYGNEATFQTSYKGEIKYVKKFSTRPIKNIKAEIVREGDVFEREEENGEVTYKFKPVPFNGNPVAGLFAVCEFEDGGLLLEEMSKDQINEVRNGYSKQANGNTWKKSWDEMAKKTILRRLCKRIATDFETAEAREAWEAGSDADFNKGVIKSNPAKMVDAFAKKVEPEPDPILNITPEEVEDGQVDETV